MRTIMLGKQKGGVGGSTIIRELSVAAAADGLRVALIDLDYQGTLRRWWATRTNGEEGQPNPALVTPNAEGLAEALEQLRGAKMDLVLIDAPPSVHPFFASTMPLADLILVPTGPTVDDIDALPPVLEAIEAAGKPFAFVLTRAPTGKSRLIDDAMPVLAQRGRVGPIVRARNDYPTARASGSTGFETKRSKAAEEIAELWAWVRGLVKLRPRRP